jgi:TonB family protein
MYRYLSGFALVVAASLLPAAGHAQKPTNESSASASGSREQTYLAYEVERAAKPRTTPNPVYPSHLRSARVEGSVLVQFIVDQRGRPEMTSFKVIKSTNAELTESVRTAVSEMSFFPAEAAGQKVKQLVQLPFKFAPDR